MFANQPQENITTESDLTLTGGCGYEIQNDRVIINIAEIANHRELENISGTLSIELWALDKPYTGAEFSGLALAGTPIGELFGQHCLNNCRYELNFQEPSTGTWYLTLMLREWIGMGYLTRDYVNFALPYIVNSNPAILRNRTDNVINVSFSGNKKSLATASVEKATIPATAEVGDSGQDKPQNGTAISLENTSLEDIVSVEGNSNTLAENGNKDTASPFESLDDVLKVKGMVPTLWKKIRDLIKL